MNNPWNTSKSSLKSNSKTCLLWNIDWLWAWHRQKLITKICLNSHHQYHPPTTNFWLVYEDIPGLWLVHEDIPGLQLIQRGEIWLSNFITRHEFGPQKFLQTGFWLSKHFTRQEFGSQKSFPDILPKPITFYLIVLGWYKNRLWCFMEKGSFHFL